MSYFPIQSLVDKLDGFEIVQARIAEILALETASQQVLAVAEGKDPANWKLDVKEDAANPLGKWLHSGSSKGDPAVDPSPVVNVWYESGNFSRGDGDVIERQKHDGSFNLDCYGIRPPGEDDSRSGRHG